MFISLTSMIMSAVVMAGIATAHDPNGEPCAHRKNFECGTREGYNRGNSFVFYCNADSQVDVLELCSCVGCCYAGGSTSATYACTVPSSV
ncbi:hypothetical protein K503DRAFT_344656 [Rhizopogon vinicolor AM-OR11-026]|uniref:Uncharacterized protein n=1 Tax=Rhizopogon vinicolor AM-OR11-026 TaxID=1314800 RepID=A0A1B7MT54_9AGAM|nr:hypothetical protein K503DRAFT_344656 [Rhizopogon vinicolor AM-OR11-026]